LHAPPKGARVCFFKKKKITRGTGGMGKDIRRGEKEGPGHRQNEECNTKSKHPGGDDSKGKRAGSKENGRPQNREIWPVRRWRPSKGNYPVGRTRSKGKRKGKDETIKAEQPWKIKLPSP